VLALSGPSWSCVAFVPAAYLVLVLGLGGCAVLGHWARQEPLGGKEPVPRVLPPPLSMPSILLCFWSQLFIISWRA